MTLLKNINQRFLAFLLAAMMIVCGGAIIASAQSVQLKNIGEYSDSDLCGDQWFSNIHVTHTIGVVGVCFPRNASMQRLNHLVDRIITEGLENQPVEIRFSGGRFCYYVDAERLMQIRLQTIEDTIERTSREVEQLTQALIQYGVHSDSVVLGLLQAFQDALDLYTYDLDRIHTAPIGERHNFFLRFCRFYGRDLRPFVEWVIEQDFRRDRVHDTFWTTDIVGALNPFVVADPRNYAEGAEAWYALNQRIQEILTMQYWSVSPYALAQLEIVKLRIYFFMEDLNRENALGYQDTIAWLNQILDDHLSLRRYLDAEGWILYPPMLRDLNTAIDAGIVRVLDDVMGVVEPVRLWPERGRPLDNAQENLLGLMGTGSGMFFM